MYTEPALAVLSGKWGVDWECYKRLQPGAGVSLWSGKQGRDPSVWGYRGGCAVCGANAEEIGELISYLGHIYLSIGSHSFVID